MRRVICILIALGALVFVATPVAATTKLNAEGLKGCRTLAKVYAGDLTLEQQALVAGDALTHLQKVKSSSLRTILASFADDPDSPAALGDWCKSHYAKDTAVSASAYATTTTTMPPEYPKEVGIDSITDSRVRDEAARNAAGNTTVFERAPCVYADKGHQTTIGSLSQYTSIYGLCADVNAYRAQGHSAGGSCW